MLASVNDRSRKDPRIDSLPPPRAEHLGKKRARRPSDTEAPSVGAAPIVPEDDAELISTLAARLITAEQARKRAEEREREARARADSVEARVAEGASAPALVGDLARRLSEVSLRISAREAMVERDLADLRVLRGAVVELAELAWRLAGPATATQLPAFAPTDPPPIRTARMSQKTSPSIRRQR